MAALDSKSVGHVSDGLVGVYVVLDAREDLFHLTHHRDPFQESVGLIPSQGQDKGAQEGDLDVPALERLRGFGNHVIPNEDLDEALQEGSQFLVDQPANRLGEPAESFIEPFGNFQGRSPVSGEIDKLIEYVDKASAFDLGPFHFQLFFGYGEVPLRVQPFDLGLAHTHVHGTRRIVVIALQDTID